VEGTVTRVKLINMCEIWATFLAVKKLAARRDTNFHDPVARRVMNASANLHAARVL